MDDNIFCAVGENLFWVGVWITSIATHSSEATACLKWQLCDAHHVSWNFFASPPLPQTPTATFVAPYNSNAVIQFHHVSHWDFQTELPFISLWELWLEHESCHISAFAVAPSPGGLPCPRKRTGVSVRHPLSLWASQSNQRLFSTRLIMIWAGPVRAPVAVG